MTNHINVPDTFYPQSSPIAWGDFPLIWEGGSHAIHFRCIVCHKARCTTITYPNVTVASLQLCSECAIQAIVRGWSSYPSRNSPSQTTAHNPTRRHRLAWGTELGHHSPVGREAPGRVGRYRRSMQGRRRGHLVFLISSQRRRVISRRKHRITNPVTHAAGQCAVLGDTYSAAREVSFDTLHRSVRAGRNGNEHAMVPTRRVS